MREATTTVLDAVGLLLVAGGAGAAAGQAATWAGLVAAGAVIFAGTGLSSWLELRAIRRELANAQVEGAQ